jgi:hypothetical protein
VATRLFQSLESHGAGDHESFIPGELGFGGAAHGLPASTVGRGTVLARELVDGVTNRAAPTSGGR